MTIGQKTEFHRFITDTLERTPAYRMNNAILQSLEAAIRREPFDNASNIEVADTLLLIRDTTTFLGMLESFWRRLGDFPNEEMGELTFFVRESREFFSKYNPAYIRFVVLACAENEKRAEREALKETLTKASDFLTELYNLLNAKQNED